MIKPLIFAGTTEGKEIALYFDNKNIPAVIFTATDYGKMVLPEFKHAEIITGRKDYNDMVAYFKSMENENIIIIDATHPYASIVTENLYNAAKELHIAYFRLLRPSTYESGAKEFESIEEAVTYLNTKEGNILLATGSKELAKYTGINDISRLYPRVLPDEHVIKNIKDLGFVLKNIICMQGPFSTLMNEATLKQVNAKFLVTKDTGKAGGFDEKLLSANNTGAELIVIKRPYEKVQGYNMQEIINIIEEKYLRA